jgi:hypothetical protein
MLVLASAPKISLMPLNGLAGLPVMVVDIWSRKFLTTSHEVGRSQAIDRSYDSDANDFPILISKKLLGFSHRVLALRDPWQILALSGLQTPLNLKRIVVKTSDVRIYPTEHALIQAEVMIYKEGWW